MSRATAGAVDGRRLRCGLGGGAADMKVRDSPYSIGARTRGGLSVLALSGTCPANARRKAVLLLLSLMPVA